MSSSKKQPSARKSVGEIVQVNDLNQCVVCFKSVEIFSIGECDHPVCYECSTRMRVLCMKNECMICRREISKVIFSRDILPFTVLDKQLRSGFYEKKFRIYFADTSIQQAFYKLLENKCQVCNKSFHSFDQLKEHVRKSHELYFCDLCTENLKIFSAERRCYNRTDLATHRRKGDVDDTSHRGHPICEYCDLRFLDKDELFRHLRREHYFCHFCDADGNNLFYINYDALRDHFKSEHFLCEEADCAQEQFTAVFRTEIDLKAHRANIHSRNLSKSAARQARTLELEFAFTPRNNRNNGFSENARSGQGGGGNRRGYVDTQTNFDDSQADPEPIMNKPIQMNAEDFPSLAGGTGASLVLAGNITMRQVSYGQAGLARTKENFPALSGLGGSIAAPSTSSGPSIKSANASKSSKPSTSSLLKTTPQQSTTPFVASSSSNQKGTKSVQNTQVPNRPKEPNKKEMTVVDAFPALPTATTKSAKKNNKINSNLIMEDFTEVSAVDVNLVNAKHRATLMENYVSVAAAKAPKINLVKKDELITEKKTNVVPTLNSINNFPSLGDSSAGTSSAPIWVSSTNGPTKKQKGNKNQENSFVNSKKVAPAPDLYGEISSKKSTKNSQTNQSNDNSKKAVVTENSKSNPNQKKVQENVAAKNNSSNQKKAVENTQEQKKPDNSQNQKKAAENSQNPKKKKKKANDNGITVENNEKKQPQPPQQNEVKSGKKQNSSELKLNEKSSGPPPAGQTNTGNHSGKNNKSTPSLATSSISVNSVARNLNNVTISNSMGEDYSYSVPVTAATNNSLYTYLPLPDFRNRNQVLLQAINYIVKNSEGLDEFVAISKLFREGSYYPTAFYADCKIILGDKFDIVFPELLALLPDIPKQQSLYLIYCQDQNKSKKPKKSPLEVCCTCKQIVLPEDLVAHGQLHVLEIDFPSLG